ncbi:HNH endonuclease [Vibrio phage 5P1c]
MTSKLVMGKGLNDASYPVSKKGYRKGKRVVLWQCPYYVKWHSMLRRCYSSYTHNKQPTYRECYVEEDWLVFSNFKSWMEKQEWDGNHLDKDLLSEGNKVYSASNCRFIHPLINKFILGIEKPRTGKLIGAGLTAREGKYASTCRNPFTGKAEFLGYFITEKEAHHRWFDCKMKFAHELVERGYALGDEDVEKALIAKIEAKKTY